MKGREPMKKWIIAAAALLAAVLIVPIPTASFDDGGTREFKALTYKIVKWNHMYEGDLCYNSTRFYFGKDKNKPVSELWKEIAPDSPFTDTQTQTPDPAGEHSAENPVIMRATVLEITADTVTVEPAEGSPEQNSADKIVIPKVFISENSTAAFPVLRVGDTVEIGYDGMIAETYPAQIRGVYYIKQIAPSKTDTRLLQEHVLLEHDGTRVYINQEDSDYVLSVLEKSMIIHLTVFGGSRDYTIILPEDTYGIPEKVYYDMETGEIGKQSVGCVPAEEKARFDNILTGYFAIYGTDGRQGETIKSTSAAVVKTAYNKADSVHYIRSAKKETKTAYPYIVVIRSKEELTEYYNSNKSVWFFNSNDFSEQNISFKDAIAKYDDAYFKENALIMVVTSESSGSFAYRNAKLSGSTVTVERLKPQVCTCDMAYWHIILEVPQSSSAPGSKINIEFTDIDV